jgi:molybdate transport system substrate-binding protein
MAPLHEGRSVQGLAVAALVRGSLYSGVYHEWMRFRVMRNQLRGSLLALALGLVAAGAHAADKPAGGAGAKSIVIFAAASLTDVLGEINTAFTAKTGIEVKPSFAASSALARQIEGGARAEVFFSADEEWMNYLGQRKLLRPQTRHDVVGNRLVLVAPADSKVAVKIKPGFSLDVALGENGRLATGDPDSVPVGKYAQAALTKLGVWDRVSPRLVRAENVRSALAFVARGEAKLGIVYGTDALAEPKVRVVDVFPENTHPPVRYPIAATTAASSAGEQYVAFVSSPASRKTFEKYGFQPLR